MNLVAFLYGVGAIINMAWPRSPQDPWYSNYAMILTSAAVLVVGALFMVTARPYDRGHAPAGDAHRLQPAIGEPIGD